MTEFFMTAMGRKYYESTLPKLAEELAQLNKQLAELVALMKERQGRG